MDVVGILAETARSIGCGMMKYPAPPPSRSGPPASPTHALSQHVRGDMRTRSHMLMHLDLDHQAARGAVRYSSIARDRGRKVSTWSLRHHRPCSVSSQKGPKVIWGFCGYCVSHH